MKKMFGIIFVSLFVLVLTVNLISAVNVKVDKTSSNEVLIAGLNKPVVFNLDITNLGPSDSFTFYTFDYSVVSPVGTTFIAQGERKTVQLKLEPLANLSLRGYSTNSYFIKGSDGSQQEEKITFKIIDLPDAFIVGASDIDPESQQAEVYFRNRENFDFGKVSVRLSSPFFDKEESFDLGPREIKNFTFSLKDANLTGLGAGFYTIKANVEVDGKTAETEGVIKFVEKNIVTTTKKDFGLFINTKVIEKQNAGNTFEDSQTVIKKNIISRLFTSFSPEPDSVQRDGFGVYYTWTNQIKPGETFTITIKTNWLFPVLIILLLVVVVILAKQHSGTNLSLRKRVHFVKAKGGEFALKVSISVSAKHFVERVNVVDRLPPLVKLYERYGGEHPSRVDEKNRRLEWNFDSLQPGEVRVLSYVIYSKVGVMGKFALPSATAIFEKEGQIHEETSNQAFFVAEQRKKDIED